MSLLDAASDLSTGESEREYTAIAPWLGLLSHYRGQEFDAYHSHPALHKAVVITRADRFQQDRAVVPPANVN